MGWGGGSFPAISQPPVSGPNANTLIPQPPAASLSETPGGALTGATYYVRLTYSSATGQTTPGPEASLAVDDNNLLVVQSPPGQLGPHGHPLPITGYNVFVSTSPGTETKQAAQVPLGTVWTMPTTGLVSGGTWPPFNMASIPASAEAYGQPVLRTKLGGKGADNPGQQVNRGSKSASGQGA
jgi:hypothetical protein